jgi:UDP-glucose 4-epimerase
MKILITGGAGFIGSHLADKLLEVGHSVKVLDNLSTGRIENLSSALENSDFEFISGSILDLELLELLIVDADYVFHLAAAVGVFNIVNNPLSSLLTNIRGTENVLEIASQSKTPVFLSSSSEVYGKNISDSLKEVDDRIIGSPVTLRWSYSEAKAVDESLAFAYFVEKQLPVRIVRFFNTVGPRQLGAYGMVVPRFVQSALSNAPITIYGDGNQTRCFAHIQDVIDAVIATAFVESTIGKVINIGNNFEISINDLAEKIIADTKSKSEIVHVPYAEAYGDGFEDMDRRVPNLDLIYELVGWKPLRDLTQIIYDISTEMKKDLEESNSI